MGKGGGGYVQNRKGHVRFYPYEKGGGKFLAMMKGGHRRFWGSMYAVDCSFSHIEGGRKTYPLFKRGSRKVFSCLEWGGGGGAKSFRPAIFPFCSPPSP